MSNSTYKMRNSNVEVSPHNDDRFKLNGEEREIRHSRDGDRASENQLVNIHLGNKTGCLGWHGISSCWG